MSQIDGANKAVPRLHVNYYYENFPDVNRYGV